MSELAAGMHQANDAMSNFGRVFSSQFTIYLVVVFAAIIIGAWNYGREKL